MRKIFAFSIGVILSLNSMYYAPVHAMEHEDRSMMTCHKGHETDAACDPVFKETIAPSWGVSRSADDCHCCFGSADNKHSTGVFQTFDSTFKGNLYFQGHFSSFLRGSDHQKALLFPVDSHASPYDYLVSLVSVRQLK